MPPRASTRVAPSAKAKAEPKTEPKAVPKPKAKAAAKKDDETKPKKTAAKAAAKPAAKATTKTTKAKTTAAASKKAETTKKAATKKAATKADSPAKATKAKTTKETKETKEKVTKPKVAATKPKVEKPVPAPPKPAASKKRARSPEPAERPKKEPVPVKRRRTGPLVNAIPGPAPANLQLFVWGTGDMGQFGEGPDELDEKPRPQKQKWLAEKLEDGELGSAPDVGGIEAVAAGGMHSLAIDEQGHVRSWGINDNACLGRVTNNVTDPSNPDEKIPNEDLEAYPYVVEELAKAGFRAVKVAAGDSISVAVSDKSELRAWGSFRSDEGVMGFYADEKKDLFQFTPVELDALRSVEVVDAVCGADHVLALTSDGYVYSWGKQQQGQLGWKTSERHPRKCLDPQRLQLRKIVHVAAGQYHSFAVDVDGKVYAWGLNSFNQLGLDSGDDVVVLRPTVVTALLPENHGGAKVIQMAGGEHHSLFLFDNGEVWGVGRCDANQLGLADDHPAQKGLAQRRQEKNDAREEKVKEAQAALDAVKNVERPNRNLVDRAEDELAKAKEAIGRAVDEMVPEPVRIPFPPIPESYESPPALPPYSDTTTNPVSAIAAGLRYNLAVSRAGHAYSWGYSSEGQLGLGASTETAQTPTYVRSKELRPYDAVRASGGGQHAVLLGKLRPVVNGA